MNEKENLATEEIAENAEVTTAEETNEEQVNAQPAEKTYTESEFNSKLDEALSKKIARKEAKIRKEYERKYNSLESVLKAGTGKDDVEEIAKDFRDFYRGQGIEIPTTPEYSSKDLSVLANAEAQEIITSGFDEVVEETDRLAKLDTKNMNEREKAVFKILAEHRQSTERVNKLASAGASKEVYESKDFTDFASKFNSETPIEDIYEIFKKTHPQKEYKTMGSMKNTDNTDETVKDFYTPEEAKKFSKKELDSNPKLYKAIEKSMLKW